jgi:Secretion system C-terminal sorting domain
MKTLIRIIFWTALLIVWRNDFVAAQYRISDFNSTDNTETNPSHVVKFNNRVFLLATDSTGKRNIWQTNGTEASTVLFMEASLPHNSNTVFASYVISNTLYFNFNQAIWKMGGDFVPKKIAEDNRQGFFEEFVLLNHKLFFNLNHYLDLRTETIRELTTKNAELTSYNTNRWASTKRTADDFWAYQESYSPKIFINFAQDTLMRSMYAADFRLTNAFNVGQQRFITSYNNNTLKLYEIVADTLALVSEQIVTIFIQRKLASRYQIVTYSLGRFLSLVFDGKSWKQTFETELLPVQFVLPALSQSGAESLLLGQIQGQAAVKLYTLNLDDGRLTPKSFEVATLYVNKQNENDDYVFVSVYLQNSLEYFAISKTTGEATPIDKDWDFGNTVTRNNTLIGGHKIPQSYISDITPPPITGLAVGFKDVEKIKKIIKKNVSVGVQIVASGDKKSLFVVGDKDNDATVYYLEEQNLNPKPILTNTGIDTRRLEAFYDSPTGLVMSGADYLKGQVVFLNINKQTRMANKVSYPLKAPWDYYYLIDSAIVFFKDNQKYTAPYGQQSSFQQTTIVGTETLANASSRIVVGHFMYVEYYEERNRYFAIIDLRNNYMYRPIAQKVRQIEYWQNQIIVVADNDVYAFDPNEPIKPKYLFSFEYNYDEEEFSFSYFDSFFTLDNHKEFWRSQATCQSSKQIHINYSASRYEITILNKYRQLFGKGALITDRKSVSYHTNDQTDTYELPSGLQLIAATTDHSFVYTVYDNSTIVLFHYDFLTKNKRELTTVEYRAGFFYRLSVENNTQYKQLYHITFGNKTLLGQWFENRPEAIQEVANTAELYQKIAAITNQNQFFTLNNQLLATDGRRVLKIDSTNQYRERFYYRPLMTTQNVYFVNTNADILKINTNDFSYKIIKAKPEWASIYTLGLIGTKLYALVNEESRGKQLWYVEDAAGEALPAATAQLPAPIIEKNQCDTKPEATASPIFVAYPNPTAGDLNILLLLNELQTPFSIEIFDLKGSKCFEQSFQKTSEDDYIRRLNVSTMSKGKYIIRCTVGNKTQHIKIIKQ